MIRPTTMIENETLLIASTSFLSRTHFRAKPLISAPLRRSMLSATALAAALLAGCAAGPDYVRPAMDAPAAFKESGPWKSAQPQQVDSQHAWWTLYGDATLDALMLQANQANQNIAQAQAQYRQASALADAARAGFFPTAGVNASGGRARTNSTGVKVGDPVSLGLTASWEPDLWGSVRRAVEAGDFASQASAADLAAARLSVQATLAQAYFQVRATDAQAALYLRTVEGYRKALALVQHQQEAGVALRSDVALAQTQLESADAQRIDLQVQRGQLEHAIAVLLGQAPSSFSLAALDEPTARLPVTPVGVPSELLERRPDIAGAERRAAQANANIGVARAAYFPRIILSGSDGRASAGLANLFSTPARVWSVGAALAGTIFDGGLRQAQDARAVAAYDAAVAQYRQTVLVGFQEVEDNLATLRVLSDESAVQDRAVQAAQLSERLALSQYRAGSANYLAVVTAQALALTNQRAAVQLRGRQFLASVALVKATGGGWTTTERNPATLAATP
jgi:NodT family efflux transporter outer membrane factor (OMF) lipoprotein